MAPLIWWFFELVWVALGATALKYPGGRGAGLFFSGVVFSFLLQTFYVVGTFRETLTGEVWIEYDSVPDMVINYLLWPCSSLLILIGVFLMLMKARGLMKRLEELNGVLVESDGSLGR